jgi:transcriptional regulator with XRE-family HTH domain
MTDKMSQTKSLSRIHSPRNPQTLAALGKQLRHVRETAGLAQGRVKDMRQGTISKIENGLEVTLDSFITYATSLGLEVALVPIGQAALFQAGRTASRPVPIDLLDEFDYLKDAE